MLKDLVGSWLSFVSGACALHPSSFVFCLPPFAFNLHPAYFNLLGRYISRNMEKRMDERTRKINHTRRNRARRYLGFEGLFVCLFICSLIVFFVSFCVFVLLF